MYRLRSIALAGSRKGKIVSDEGVPGIGVFFLGRNLLFDAPRCFLKGWRTIHGIE